MWEDEDGSTVCGGYELRHSSSPFVEDEDTPRGQTWENTFDFGTVIQID